MTSLARLWSGCPSQPTEMRKTTKARRASAALDAALPPVPAAPYQVPAPLARRKRAATKKRKSSSSGRKRKAGSAKGKRRARSASRSRKGRGLKAKAGLSLFSDWESSSSSIADYGLEVDNGAMPFGTRVAEMRRRKRNSGSKRNHAVPQRRAMSEPRAKSPARVAAGKIAVQFRARNTKGQFVPAGMVTEMRRRRTKK